LAYIAGITAFGLVPRATLEIAGGTRRLDRIFELIRGCRYSFHDLSRVESPRFNMPFELGLAVAWQRLQDDQHTWFVFEARKGRLSKSLSDLDGSDPYTHEGTPRGVFRELCNCLVRAEHQSNLDEMISMHHRLSKLMHDIQKRAGARTPFSARVFTELVLAAQAMAEAQSPRRTPSIPTRRALSVQLIARAAFHVADFRGVVVHAEIDNPTESEVQVLELRLEIPGLRLMLAAVSHPRGLTGPWLDSTPFDLKAKRSVKGGIFFPAPPAWSQHGLPFDPLKGKVQLHVYGCEPISIATEIVSLKTLRSRSTDRRP
jgi:hypothetical protein